MWSSFLFKFFTKVFTGFGMPTLTSYVGIFIIIVLEWLYFNDWQTRTKSLTPPIQEDNVDSFFRLKAGFRCLKINWQQVIKNPCHILEIIGILSYGIYLWHGEIVYFTEKIIPITNIPSYTLNVVIAWLFTCFLATLTFYSIEKIPYYISKQFK
jgi:peptidoglycan/LPS O-acetylase OafA/YrhL